MNRIEETQTRVRNLLKDFNDPIDFTNEDGEGFILEESGQCNAINERWYNYEVFSIYKDMTADTNFGHIYLVECIKDEDDWYTIEDMVEEAVENWK